MQVAHFHCSLGNILSSFKPCMGPDFGLEDGSVFGFDQQMGGIKQGTVINLQNTIVFRLSEREEDVFNLYFAVILLENKRLILELMKWKINRICFFASKSVIFSVI